MVTNKVLYRRRRTRYQFHQALVLWIEHTCNRRRLPRRSVEESFDVRRWTVMHGGGHVAALELPRVLVDDVRAVFPGCADVTGGGGLPAVALEPARTALTA